MSKWPDCTFFKDGQQNRQITIAGVGKFEMQRMVNAQSEGLNRNGCVVRRLQEGTPQEGVSFYCQRCFSHVIARRFSF